MPLSLSLPELELLASSEMPLELSLGTRPLSHLRLTLGRACSGLEVEVRSSNIFLPASTRLLSSHWAALLPAVFLRLLVWRVKSPGTTQLPTLMLASSPGSPVFPALQAASPGLGLPG